MSIVIALLSTLPFPEDYRADVNAVMSYVMTEDFDSADSVAKRVIERLPESPLGHLLRLAVLEFYMTDWSTDEKDSEFMAEFDRANEICRQGIKNASDRAQRAKFHMFRGFALGFKAVHYARRYQSKMNVLRGLKYGKEAIDEISRAHQQDSTLYDCYLAMGIYDLALSYAQKKVPWLRSENRKKKGMAELAIAMERSDIFKPIVLMAYVYIYMYEANPDLALQYLGFLKSLYPGSRTLMWLEVNVNLENERWFYAQTAAQKLLEEVEKNQATCYVNQAEVKVYLALCRYYLGDKPGAEEYLSEARALLDQEKDPNRAGEKEKVQAKLREAEKRIK